MISRACPLFVLLVENDLVDSPEAERVAREYLDPFCKAGIDTLILGTPLPLDEWPDPAGCGPPSTWLAGIGNCRPGQADFNFQETA